MTPCPVCENKLEQTNYKNTIFKEFNFYCKNCNSYHIIKEKDVSDYYYEEYHNNFLYKNFTLKLVNKFSLVSNRTSGRFLFLKNYGEINKNLNFLEIGGTYGEFFNIAQKKISPKSYTIIEPDNRFNRVKKNLFFKNLMFEEININEYKDTDILQMFHVFEHIFDINGFLEKIKKIAPLTFYFEVPNCTNEKVKRDSLLNNPHNHHFSKKSIEILFEKHGFEKIRLDIIEPLSYHPYKKIGYFKRYKLRFAGKNEIISEKGIYLRGIYSI